MPAVASRPHRAIGALLVALIAAGAGDQVQHPGYRDNCAAWCNKWNCNRPFCSSCGSDIGCPDKPPPPAPPPRPPPQPSLPPFDYDRISPGALHFEGKDGQLYANDAIFNLKGANWFGSEGRAGPPLGLDKHSISWYMEWLKEHNFNAVRLLFNHEMILSDAPLESPDTAKLGENAKWEAPELAHFRYLKMFGKIAEIAAESGILVMMAAHRLSPKAWPGDGLWYDQTITEEKVMQSWDKISKELCKQWNVFAVDLQNEPHAASWGKSKARGLDWPSAASRLGNNVLNGCARWLIFVEGVGWAPGAPNMDNPADGIWWGENLAGVKQQPVTLLDQSKLVYSPHTYGPSVYKQKYFSSPLFPDNMAEIWSKRFAFGTLYSHHPIRCAARDTMLAHYLLSAAAAVCSLVPCSARADRISRDHRRDGRALLGQGQGLAGLGHPLSEERRHWLILLRVERRLQGHWRASESRMPPPNEHGAFDIVTALMFSRSILHGAGLY